MIDIHSHVLPGIDDGAKTLDESIEMLKIAQENGTKEIICTPHYCLEIGEETYDSVKQRIETLKKEAKKAKLKIKIHYGQEVYYTENLLDDYENGKIGTLNGTKYMLIEFPMRDDIEREHLETMYELKLMGVVPVIAHPERYSKIQRRPSLLNSLIDEGCLFQLNGGSVLGKYGDKAKDLAEKLIQKNIYSFIGSDGHNPIKRNTNLSESLEKIKRINEEYIEIFKENGEKLLNNQKVTFKGEYFEKKKKKKAGGFLSFFRK